MTLAWDQISQLMLRGVEIVVWYSSGTMRFIWLAQVELLSGRRVQEVWNIDGLLTE